MKRINDNWVVKIPAGRWMAGPQYFETKAALIRWMGKWNEAEVGAGKPAVEFRRVSGTKRFEEAR